MRKPALFGLLIAFFLTTAMVTIAAGGNPTGDVESGRDIRSQEGQVSPLKEVVYVQEQGRPKALFNSEGVEIVRIETVADSVSGTRQRVVREVASGEIIYAVDLPVGADEPAKRLCLDGTGSIVRNARAPLIVGDFDVYASIPPGTAMNGTTNDAYGRVSERYRYVFPCETADEDHCQVHTNSEACVFVWTIG
ncbi:hypothetical protein ACGF5M_02930 [Gemmatimonadota bacterium]